MSFIFLYDYRCTEILFVSLSVDFFSPANVMKLLEVVKGTDSSPSAIASSMTLGKRIGKTTVLAGNCFGFIGNRMLSPYSYEAGFLLEEGCSPAQVDAVLKKDIGMAMGPFEVIDYTATISCCVVLRAS